MGAEAFLKDVPSLDGVTLRQVTEQEEDGRRARAIAQGEDPDAMPQRVPTIIEAPRPARDPTAGSLAEASQDPSDCIPRRTSRLADAIRALGPREHHRQ